MRPHASRIAGLAALAWCLAAFPPAQAAHAAVGTSVADAELATLDGGRARLLGDGASVLVFFRPGQDRSLGALRELARCQTVFAGKPVRWVGIVSDAAPAAEASALAREARFALPVLVDKGDAVYGSLGISLHPVVVVVGTDRRLAAFEPFRSVDYCTVVTARIRRALGEISDDELRAVLDPPKATEGGDAQAARSYRSLAEAQLRAGSYDKALQSVRKAIEKDPTLAAVHALEGEIRRANDDCAAAGAAYGRALAIDPGNAVAKSGMEACRAGR